MNKYTNAIIVINQMYLQDEITYADFCYLVKWVTSKYVENQFMERYLPKLDNMMSKLDKMMMSKLLS
jgi:hypothetical protein